MTIRIDYDSAQAEALRLRRLAGEYSELHARLLLVLSELQAVWRGLAADEFCDDLALVAAEYQAAQQESLAIAQTIEAVVADFKATEAALLAGDRRNG